MNIRKKQQESTRRAILDALGEEIAASGGIGFSHRMHGRLGGGSGSDFSGSGSGVIPFRR